MHTFSIDRTEGATQFREKFCGNHLLWFYNFSCNLNNVIFKYISPSSITAIEKQKWCPSM